MTAPAHAHPVASPALDALRTRLETVITGARPAGTPWATGIAPLDAALGGGIPRGRITEVTGPLGGGKTALLRQVAARVLRTGGWVAWIDAKRTLAAAPFVGLGDRLVVVRPKDPGRSAWIADCLLRSGLFALVVLDAPPPLARVPGIRLAQLARDRDAACVVLSDDPQPSHIHGTLRLRLTPTAPPPRRRPVIGPGGITRETVSATSGTIAGFAVHVEKGAGPTTRRAIEVECGIGVARRLCADSEVPDRRGVADHARGGSPVERPGTPPAREAAGGTAGLRPGGPYAASSPPPSGDAARSTLRPRLVTHRRGRRRAATPRLGSPPVRAGA